jgi:hypothetical protein
VTPPNRAPERVHTIDLTTSDLRLLVSFVDAELAELAAVGATSGRRWNAIQALRRQLVEALEPIRN